MFPERRLSSSEYALLPAVKLLLQLLQHLRDARPRLVRTYGLCSSRSRGAGLERKEIGHKLGISTHTVHAQIKRMLEECSVNNRIELLNTPSGHEGQRAVTMFQ